MSHHEFTLDVTVNDAHPELASNVEQIATRRLLPQDPSEWDAADLRRALELRIATAEIVAYNCTEEPKR